MTIASPGRRIAFDSSICWNRHGTRITLIAICGEVDVGKRLRAIHDGVRNSNVRTLVLARAEVRMESIIRPNEVDDGSRVGIDRHIRDINIPRTIVRERTKSAQIGPQTHAHGAAVAARSGSSGAAGAASRSAGTASAARL